MTGEAFPSGHLENGPAVYPGPDFHEERAAWLLRPEPELGLTSDDIAAGHAHAQLATSLRLAAITHSLDLLASRAMR